MTKTTQEDKPGLGEHPSMATPAEFQTTQGHPRGLGLHTTFGRAECEAGTHGGPASGLGGSFPGLNHHPECNSSPELWGPFW